MGIPLVLNGTRFICGAANGMIDHHAYGPTDDFINLVLQTDDKHEIFTYHFPTMCEGENVKVYALDHGSEDYSQTILTKAHHAYQIVCEWVAKTYTADNLPWNQQGESATEVLNVNDPVLIPDPSDSVMNQASSPTGSETNLAFDGDTVYAKLSETCAKYPVQVCRNYDASTWYNKTFPAGTINVKY
jgi:hypothetical protein